MTKRLIDKYWKFDVVQFVKDYPDYKRILNDKKAALEEITQVKSPNFDSPPGTPGRGDCVVAAAEKSEELKNGVAEYQHIVDLYENAEKQLTAEEKMIIRYFFHEPGIKSSHVRFLMSTLHYEKTVVYDRRAETLDKIKKLLRV